MKKLHVRQFFADKDGNLVLWQMPNTALLGWLLFLLLAKIVPAGEWRTAASAVSSLSLFIWALLELFSGVSYFRRLLGLVVLCVMVGSRF